MYILYVRNYSNTCFYVENEKRRMVVNNRTFIQYERHRLLLGYHSRWRIWKTHTLNSITFTLSTIRHGHSNAMWVYAVNIMLTVTLGLMISTRTTRTIQYWWREWSISHILHNFVDRKHLVSKARVYWFSRTIVQEQNEWVDESSELKD